MTRIDKSESQNIAEAAQPLEERDLARRSRKPNSKDVHRCTDCGHPYLEGYPHHHETGLRPAYDPMPVRPQDHAELIAVIRHEYFSEIPARLHTRQVPSHAEPIGVSQYSAEAAGYVVTDATEDALDVGPLGSPPWSMPFHQYIGSWTFQFGEVTRKDGELQRAPWTRSLEGVRRWCAGKHRTWYEHRGNPICWTLARLVVEGGYSVSRAAADPAVVILPDTAERLLFGWTDDRERHHDGALDKWWLFASNDLNEIQGERIKPRQAA